MALTFLFDEHLRGWLARAVRLRSASSSYPIDLVCVGEPPDLPLRSPDPAILLWAERAGRIILSRDKNTMIGDFYQHLQGGHHSPGLLVLLDGISVGTIISELELTAHAGDPADFFDQVKFFPDQP